jgi:hypothetical protein
MRVAWPPVITAAWRQKPSNEGTSSPVSVGEGMRGKLVAAEQQNRLVRALMPFGRRPETNSQATEFDPEGLVLQY